jgi:hypothetical protein
MGATNPCWKTQGAISEPGRQLGSPPAALCAWCAAAITASPMLLPLPAGAACSPALLSQQHRLSTWLSYLAQHIRGCRVTQPVPVKHAITHAPGPPLPSCRQSAAQGPCRSAAALWRQSACSHSSRTTHGPQSLHQGTHSTHRPSSYTSQTRRADAAAYCTAPPLRGSPHPSPHTTRRPCLPRIRRHRCT